MKKRGCSLTDFVHNLSWADVPDPVRRRLKLCLLDLVGCALAGTRTPVFNCLLAFARGSFASGRCTVIGYGPKIGPLGAALVNAAATSALDLDDGYRPVMGHPGAAVFPAALAVAEEVGATGWEFLLALLVGYEVGIRAGLGLHRHYRYYHGTGSWGAVGAAAAAGRLLRLEPARLRQAMGIAEFHGPLTPELRAVGEPTMVKDGIIWGSFVGASAALLAAAGFTGISTLLELPRFRQLAADLGRRWYILELYFKPYSCCRWAHPAVDAALELARLHGIKASDIGAITVYTFGEAARLRVVEPRTTEEAQFSLPWPVAAAVVDGTVGPAQVLDRLGDPEIVGLARRVRIRVDPELDRQFPMQTLARVELALRDGRVLTSRVRCARGDAEDPMSEDELRTKFRRLAREVCGVQQAARIEAAIERLEWAERICEFAELLAGKEGADVADS